MWSNSEQGLVSPRTPDLETPRPSLPPGELPPIHNLNVTNSSRFHLGPKNITITQNNVVRGRLLCLELVSPHQARRLRCSVAVFVCWALVVAAGLAVCLLFLTINRQIRLDIGLNETWYLRRADWQAANEYSMTLLPVPVKIVTIGHTNTPYCDERYACVRAVLAIQQEHVMGRRWDDIGPNFLVAGKGLIYEGRGANVVDLPLWQYLYNVVKNTTRAERISCVAAILLVMVCNLLIIYFTLFAKKPSPPDVEVDWLVPREVWLAKPHNYTDFLEYPVPLVVVQHTVSAECTDFITCAAEMRFLQDMYLNPIEYGYDIPYNFLIGNDGRVYVGRGWGVVGAHTRGYNWCSIGLAFTGDYRTEEEGRLGGSRVSALQLTRMLQLVEQGVRRGRLHPRYRILAARDVTKSASPGGNLHQALRQLAHYDHKQQFRNKTCTFINAMPEFTDDNSGNFTTTDSTQITELQTDSVI